jgi:acyl-CoA thioesterase-1
MWAESLRRAACLFLVALVCAVGGQECRAGTTHARKGGGRARPRPVVYLALGDSTGAGVGAEHGGYAARLYSRIERARPGSRLVNLCASAAATADLLGGQVGRVGEQRPTLITVGVGANDLIRGVPAETFARNFEEIVVRLKRQTQAPVVVMNIPDMSLAPAVPAYMRDSARRHIQVFNGHIASIAGRYGLPVVDLFGRSREFSSHPEFFSPDGLHPSDAGYEYWAGLLWPYAEKQLGKG